MDTYLLNQTSSEYHPRDPPCHASIGADDPAIFPGIEVLAPQMCRWVKLPVELDIHRSSIHQPLEY